MRTGLLLGLLAIVSTVQTAAQNTTQNTVQLTRTVFVERQAFGSTARTVEPATEFRKGDTVILMVKWQGAADGKGFVVSSPIPSTLNFQRSSQDGQIVSVDGGRSWGQLGDLKIATGSRTRLASAEDVTHLRWRISARSAAQGRGQLTYSAIVR